MLSLSRSKNCSRSLFSFIFSTRVKSSLESLVARYIYNREKNRLFCFHRRGDNLYILYLKLYRSSLLSGVQSKRRRKAAWGLEGELVKCALRCVSRVDEDDDADVDDDDDDEESRQEDEPHRAARARHLHHHAHCKRLELFFFLMAFVLYALNCLHQSFIPPSNFLFNCAAAGNIGNFN